MRLVGAAARVVAVVSPITVAIAPRATVVATGLVAVTMIITVVGPITAVTTGVGVASATMGGGREEGHRNSLLGGVGLVQLLEEEKGVNMAMLVAMWDIFSFSTRKVLRTMLLLVMGCPTSRSASTRVLIFLRYSMTIMEPCTSLENSITRKITQLSLLSRKTSAAAVQRSCTVCCLLPDDGKDLIGNGAVKPGEESEVIARPSRGTGGAVPSMW